MKTCFLILSVAILLRFHCFESRVPEEVSSRIRNQEEIVTRLANRVVQLFDRRHSYLRNCECSRHSCSNDITGFECTNALGNVEGICGTDCEGRMINFNTSVHLTPPGVNITNLSPRLKESTCLYSNLEPLMKELVPQTDPSWIYFGGVDGSFRLFPATPWPRGFENGDENLGQCRTFDPRTRPWFIGASTRPKDIVFVLDVSDSMNEVDSFSEKSRWDVTRKAVVSMLGTLASFDYVNIVAFSEQARRFHTKSSLLQGTDKNLQYLISEVENEHAAGGTNIDAGFREAFDILSDACGENTEPQSCSECQKIILFLTDGRHTSDGDGRTAKASEILNNIQRYQRNLEETTSQRAAIFTFSMGDSADDSIPRQIACANSGSWSYIGPETDALTAMNSYYYFLTSTGNAASPIWINPYEDDGGLGQITTVAKAVYSRRTSDLEGIFLGVVGYDVQLRDLGASGVPYTDVLEAIIERSRICNLTTQTPCQLQVHRNAYANRAVCADNIPSDNTSNSTCYRGPTKYYKLFTRGVDWDGAVDQCEQDEGRLVVIESEDELAFVAGVSSPDGSWIGARRNGQNSDIMEWIDATVDRSSLETSSPYWGIGEPNNKGVEDCVQIDRRGVNGNLNDEDCSTELSFICEYSSRSPCSGVVNVPREGYFSNPPLNVCLNEEESLRNARPSETAENLASEDIMCPFGEQKNSVEVICCNECETKSTETKRTEEDDRNIGLILGAAIPGALIALFILALFCRSLRSESKAAVVAQIKPNRTVTV